jgi:hypothetical protein
MRDFHAHLVADPLKKRLRHYRATRAKRYELEFSYGDGTQHVPNPEEEVALDLVRLASDILIPGSTDMDACDLIMGEFRNFRPCIRGRINRYDNRLSEDEENTYQEFLSALTSYIEENY